MSRTAHKIYYPINAKDSLQTATSEYTNASVKQIFRFNEGFSLGLRLRGLRDGFRCPRDRNNRYEDGVPRHSFRPILKTRSLS